MSKAYEIIIESFEASVRYGYNRAHKHNESPDAEDIIHAIVGSLEYDVWELIHGLCFQIAVERIIEMGRDE